MADTATFRQLMGVHCHRVRGNSTSIQQYAGYDIINKQENKQTNDFSGHNTDQTGLAGSLR